jgi:hypothetical protein
MQFKRGFLYVQHCDVKCEAQSYLAQKRKFMSSFEN